jgi:selT/selW/selH-like putative selenoprotein
MGDTSPSEIKEPAEQPAPGAKPDIVIHYCTLCQWQLRAAWMAQEILQTFGDQVHQVALRPGTGGVFTISVDEQVIWDRKRDDGFPSVKELKQRVRDAVAPGHSLGHLDK